MLVECYVDSDFAVLWGHENPQDPICDNSRTVFVVTFSNDIYHLHYEYVALSHSIRDLLPLKIIIKQLILELVMYSEKLKFVSRYTFREDNNGTIQGSFHNNFPGFSGFGFRRKLAHTKTQQGTDKASE